MDRLSSARYDDCMQWVQKKIDRKVPWDVIRMAGKLDDSSLQEFLDLRVIDDCWPQMSVQEWKDFVSVMEENESKQQSIQFRGNEGALFDINQDNGLSIPVNERSSWQLYKNSLSWKENSVKQLEEATIGILRRLSSDTSVSGPVKGLVIGHVQSGKTANMEALMAMAADYGWNLFIVLSGTIESLRIQTLKRMQKDLNQEGNLIWRGVEHPSRKSQYGERIQDLRFEPGSKSRFFTVCLKHSNRLKKLIDWIHAERNSHANMKILIIDDEADQASISNTAAEYKKSQKERKGINKLIVNLVSDVHYKESSSNGKAKAINYVMYTATPYANFLNECVEESLYPHNFIWTLQTSDEYIGPNQIFGYNNPDMSDGLDIKRAVSESDLDRIVDIYNGCSSELPETMKDAICWFLCSVSSMRKWGYQKPISMLVHTSQKQICHSAVAQAITFWINCPLKHREISERCKIVYEYETERISKDAWLSQFSDYGVPAEMIRDYLPFCEIAEEIETLLAGDLQHIRLTDEGDFQYHQGLHMVIDNCSQNGLHNENEYVRLAYPDPDMENYPSPAPAFIIVGGNTLSRGLTLEGLVSTFFLRASCQADTLMQMGRWFGYRHNYELLPRLWMTEDTIDKYRFLSELEVDLREDLRRYMLSDCLPKDYGPRILCSPKVSWLKLTSKKHMTNARPAEMDFSGARPQTIIFDNDAAVQNRNIEVTMDFLNRLGAPSKKSHDKSALCWKGVSLELIMKEFLIDKFCFSDRSRVFNEISSFCDWIRKLSSEKNVLESWSVVAAGNGEIKIACEEDQKHWVIAGYSLGKVNRSRRIPRNETDSYIDIGALRALKDLLADIDDAYFDSDEIINRQEQVDRIRLKAGADKVPMLIIYRIDGKSKKRINSGSDRIDMNCPFDIIGIQIVVPGDQLNTKFCRKLTIRLSGKDREAEVEELS